jgi:pilus assembly protein CpaB
VASVAGGFIFPNNRVDILLTTVSGDPKQGTTRVVLSNVRVVAIDQASDDKNQKAVSDVKTVTLELTPAQARTVNMAQVMGTLSLALRSLGDEAAVAANAKPASAQKKEDEESGMVTVLRYGLARKGGGGGVQ